MTQHLARPDLDPFAANDVMLERIARAIENGQPLSEGQANFMLHELTEADLMDQGVPHELAHEQALTTRPPGRNYDPDVDRSIPGVRSLVAQDERLGATVITIDVKRHGLVAVDGDDERARFAQAGRLSAGCQLSHGLVRSARVLVEVQRCFGGLAPRALLGAEFLAAPSTGTVFEVAYASQSDGPPAMCPSRLWKRPFIVGLPEEFASAVLDGLLGEGVLWPAGVLRVDRAGFDKIESSAWVFEQAAGVVACALTAMLRGQDVEAEVRALMMTW